ncbi:hypothetical protein HLBS07_02150 [Vibrio alginolyticus]|nr:hypothetical protein HLBS07_02150 [Vibrio alginolyticus]
MIQTIKPKKLEIKLWYVLPSLLITIEQKEDNIYIIIAITDSLYISMSTKRDLSPR